MKKRREIEKHNPFRRPDWRWQRVLDLVERFPAPGRCSRGDDEWVQAARSFLCYWRNGDERLRDQLHQEIPGLVYAIQIYEQRKDTPLPASFIEARLLAGQAAELIAKEHSTIPAAVRWYEALFFNVREYLHHRDWITSRVLAPLVISHLDCFAALRDDGAAAPARPPDAVTPVALPFDDVSLKFYAYFGGPVLVDLMIH